ncbi:hypothetical protein SVIOM342S_07247 [Streptomyces violaceorubidus]
MVASAATVALALLALLLSDLTNNRALGPVGAIGIVCAVLSTLTFLPAVLVLLGRAAYWPARPVRTGDPEAGHRLWHRVAELVDRAPRRIWAISLAALLACAAFAPTLSSKGVPLDEIFVNDTPSVAAQRTLARHFPGGSGNPAVIIAEADRLAPVHHGTIGIPLRIALIVVILLVLRAVAKRAITRVVQRVLRTRRAGRRPSAAVPAGRPAAPPSCTATGVPARQRREQRARTIGSVLSSAVTIVLFMVRRGLVLDQVGDRPRPSAGQRRSGRPGHRLRRPEPGRGLPVRAADHGRGPVRRRRLGRPR